MKSNELVTINDLKVLKEEIIDELRKSFLIPPQNKKWLKTSEVKEQLGCSDGTLVNLRSSGMLKFSKLRGTIYILQSDVDKLLSSNISA